MSEFGEEHVSEARKRAFESRGSAHLDPDIPGVQMCEWSAGSLLDRVCLAIYDSELFLREMEFEDEFHAAMAVVSAVSDRVRVRGLRPQDGAAEAWESALPGMQGAHSATDRGALYTVASALYHARDQVSNVLPRLDLDRALALADALVIAETTYFREGATIDEMGENGWTPCQARSAGLRGRWLARRSMGMGAMSDAAAAGKGAVAKGGGR